MYVHFLSWLFHCVLCVFCVLTFLSVGLLIFCLPVILFNCCIAGMGLVAWNKMMVWHGMVWYGTYLQHQPWPYPHMPILRVASVLDESASAWDMRMITPPHELQTCIYIWLSRVHTSPPTLTFQNLITSFPVAKGMTDQVWWQSDLYWRQEVVHKHTYKYTYISTYILTPMQT